MAKQSNMKEFSGCNSVFKEFAYIALRNNYKLTRIKGSHYIFKNTMTGDTVAANANLNMMVAKRLKEQVTGVI